MKRKPMHANDPHVLVARRFLDHGFIDAALRLFVRDAAAFEQCDWSLLAARLMERGRVADAVRVCELGGVPLPRERVLALGDAHLRRGNFEGAIRCYELGGADRERWAQVVDLLTALPDQERRAVQLADRHLVGAEARRQPSGDSGGQSPLAGNGCRT